VWQDVNYFLLWAVRLSGLLPELAVSPESREIAEEMLHTPVAQMTPRIWARETAADLRRMLVRGIEEHIERRLITLPLLESAAAAR
jgi:DNA repair protein RecO (recombination protein O)